MAGKKTYRGKRMYRRKFWAKKSNWKSKRIKPKYDGTVFFKIHLIGDVKFSTTYGNGSIVVNWGNNQVSSATPTICVNQANEWTVLSPLYNQFKIIGYKCRIQPMGQMTNIDFNGPQPSIAGYMQTMSGSDLDGVLPGYTTTQNQLVGYKDYKSSMGGRQVNRYYHVSRYFKSRDVDWQNVNSIGSNPTCGTLYQCYGYGFTDGYPMARYHVTYYVAFKGSAI